MCSLNNVTVAQKYICLIILYLYLWLYAVSKRFEILLDLASSHFRVKLHLCVTNTISWVVSNHMLNTRSYDRHLSQR